MTPHEERGGHRAVVPFRPTEVKVAGNLHEPTVCFCCGRGAAPMGIGNRRFEGDPKYLCQLCWMIVEHIRATTNFDLHELAAVEKAGRIGGAYLERIGKFDMSEMTPGEWNYFLREIIEGFSIELRNQIREGVPFSLDRQANSLLAGYHR